MIFPHSSFVKSYLTTRSLQPENQESPIEHIRTDLVHPSLFYRRNHFTYPSFTSAYYWLPIRGLVEKPVCYSVQDLLRLPSRTIKAVLECAGNKRSLFEPKVFGEQWEKGAITQGEWKGVSLRTLLRAAGLKDAAKEVVVEGYDYGERTDTDTVHTYARSLPLDQAMHPDTIVAYEYNSQPIPFKHGYPLRLIVPQWYAMSSVKWIKQIYVIDSAFEGPFQSVDYVYYPYQESDEGAFPVTTMNVNSIIQKPSNMEVLNTGKHTIEGIAWSGEGLIKKVEISIDGGSTWSDAKVIPAENYAWVKWAFDWTVPVKGEYTLMAKATDSGHRMQPSTPFWNRKGYGYNAMEKVKVKVE
ncbi:sulfite oxidase [Bacillus thermotolerans]|uniref:Sulfite oxidase n=1 Tax=Bacillus thermotolerans TaxID=1221996 RepID=A0A0F5HZ72_BACTR|nr:sulfite oxidase [Bacillus thermotolerans]KKB34418.1 sulfite oxidase [Bacillus thermotolerans]KKB38162.1 putative sulfite oxidase [Bacillus thermotolerans]